MQPDTPSTTSGRAAAASMLVRANTRSSAFSRTAQVLIRMRSARADRRCVRSRRAAAGAEDHVAVGDVHLAAVGLHVSQLVVGRFAGARSAGVASAERRRPPAAGAGRDRSRWMYNPHMRWKGAAAAVFLVSAWAGVARADAPWVYRSIVLPRGEVAVDLGFGLGTRTDGPPQRLGDRLRA